MKNKKHWVRQLTQEVLLVLIFNKNDNKMKLTLQNFLVLCKKINIFSFAGIFKTALTLKKLPPIRNIHTACCYSIEILNYDIMHHKFRL